MGYQTAAPMGLGAWCIEFLLPECRPDGAGCLIHWIFATRMSPRWGWVLDALNFCYQNDDLMGLGAWCIEFLLPEYRPYGAGCLIHLISATRMSPRWGWVLDALNFCYQNIDPTGLGAWYIEFLLPECRPYGAGCLIHWIFATRMSTLRGWVLDTFNFCYQNVDPTGLGAWYIEFLLPECRPYGAGCLMHWISSTKMSPWWGWQFQYNMIQSSLGDSLVNL